MVLCRVIFDHRKPRKPRPTYASVCLLFNGGCYRNVSRTTTLNWCVSCRHLRATRRKP